MHYDAESESIRTISELATFDPDVAMMFPDGIPEVIESPGWNVDGQNEMSSCERGFFQVWCASVHEIPLKEILFYHDCIGFMDAKLASRWIGVWICAAYFAADYLNESDHPILIWVEFALERIVEEQVLTLSPESVMTFIKRVIDPYTDEVSKLQLVLEKKYPRLE